MVRYLSFVILLSILVSACNGNPSSETKAPEDLELGEKGGMAKVYEQPDTGTPLVTATPSPISPSEGIAPPKSTPLPPTPTMPLLATPKPLPTSTSTPTPEPIPTQLHPLMIEGLQQAAYNGSELVIEETLEPGDNYQRYVVSYYSEGLKIYAFMTVPDDQKPETGWPAIIINHGFFLPSQYVTSFLYVDYVDAIARNDYIVFLSDYRGHGKSEGEGFEAYTNPDLTIDALNGLASLQKYPDADPDRIGMWGHSMGGIVTLRAMVVSPEIKAGVTWGGVVGSYQEIFEWVEWRLSDETVDNSEKASFDFATENAGNWMEELIEAYGPIDDNPGFWEAISPTTYLDDISGPFQLHHSKTDKEVLTSLSENLYNQLQEADKPAELYLYDYDNHDLTGHFGLAMQRTIEFFDHHLEVDRGG